MLDLTRWWRWNSETERGFGASALGIDGLSVAWRTAQAQSEREVILTAWPLRDELTIASNTSTPWRMSAAGIGYAVLVLIATHGVMHVGQLSVIRRKLGKPVKF